MHPLDWSLTLDDKEKYQDVIYIQAKQALDRLTQERFSPILALEDLDRQPAVKEIQSVQKWACEPVGRKWVIDFVVMATPEDLKANACQCWEWPIDTCPKVLLCPFDC
ncbi:hypothetical protein PtA15_2A132 [Puccinia triticina]|uniref:Uncharacterized protein n=1 Tax=Puccinia triticina TaxID=208348 RepID=A0ABY7C9H2_9BASI|nr:uncharacterized protein PtA15_2A132 [Puccinia triticina]WAQ81820.1 hypothetical protein PtA15_2A132 [Puccinia triticina]